MKYISITVSILLHNRNKFKKDKAMFRIFSDSLNTWCHVYRLYMHSQIQHVNKNTSMPINRNLLPCTYLLRMENMSCGRGSTNFSFLHCISLEQM